MNRFDPERQESLKRMWQERRATAMDESFKHYKLLPPTLVPFTSPNPKTTRPSFSGGFDADLVAAVVPPVTVVLEGRSICQRISLDKHSSYHSLAKALRQMFVDQNDHVHDHDHDHDHLDLSNAVPGHLIAYEDMENDLLLVGDLNWK